MAGSAVVGVLRVLLSADTAEFQAAMEKAAKSADGWSKNLKSIGAQATAAGSALTKALTLPIVGIAGASLKAAVSFESSFAGIRKTVDGVVDSAGNLTAAGKEMQQAIRNLAKEIPVSVEELNKLGESAGELGIPKEKVVEFTKVMAELGVTTNLTSEEAASSIARIQNIFGAAGQDTERLASTLVGLGNAGASTEKEIVEMAQRIAGAGHTVGLTQGQVLAFASSLASVGVNAEAGGSAISRVFLKINDAVSKGGKGLDEFARVAGMSGAEFKKAFETDAAGATTKFIEGIQRLKGAGENVNATIEGLTGKNIILKDTILRLAGAGDLLGKNLALQSKLWQDNSALTTEAQQRFKTTESQMTLLWNRIKDVGITLGNALLPAITAAGNALNAVLPIIDAMAKGFAALPGSVQLIIGGMVALVAAAGPVLILFGQMSSGAADVIRIFGKKGIATRALATDQAVLEGSSRTLTASLGLLGTAAAVAGAAFVGWQIGRLIADLFDLDRKIADSLTGLNNLTRARQLSAGGDRAGAEADVAARLVELERQRTQAIQAHNLAGAALLAQQIEALKNDQTRLAIQDTINRAIKGGADAHITYADAVKFNEAALVRQREAQTSAAAATGKSIATNADAAKSVSMLSELNAKYAEDLQKIGNVGFKEIQEAHEKFGVSLKDLAGKYGVAQTSIDRWIDGTKEAAKATKAAAKELSDAEKYVKRFTDAANELDKELRAAAEAGVPMSDVLEEFGNQIETVTRKAPIFGHAVGEATKAAADALKASDLKKLSEKLLSGLNDDARQMVEKWKKAGEDAGNGLAAALAKSNARFLSDATAVQRGLIGLEEDSLEKRQKLIRLDYATKRDALDRFSTFYGDQLDLLNAEEAKALAESEARWKDHASKIEMVGSALQNIGRNIPGAVGQITSNFGGIASGIGGLIKANEEWNKSTQHTTEQIIGRYGAVVDQLIGIVRLAYDIFKDNGLLDQLTGHDLDRKTRTAFLNANGGQFGVQNAGATAGFNANRLLATDSAKEFDYQTRLFNQAVAESDRRLQAYGLTWRDLGASIQKSNVDQVARTLVKDFRDLYAQGADVTKVIKGMSGSLSQLVIDAVTTGQRIPVALQPMLRTLIESGQLSEAAARALLGMADDATPSFDEVKAAAERYGIALDQLGPKINQLRITNIAAQIIKDWQTLQAAGADTNTTLVGMQKSVQDVVTEALKAGLKIPEGMKPIIQAMIDAGLLTDQFGNKLTDIGQVEFEAPITKAIDALLKKLDELIDKLSNVGKEAVRTRGEMEAIGTAVPRGSTSNAGSFTNGDGGPSAGSGSAVLPGGATVPVDDSSVPGTAQPRGGIRAGGANVPGRRYATGGIVGRILQFPTAQGTDRIPVLASEGEGFLNAPAMARIGRDGFEALNSGWSVRTSSTYGAPSEGRTVQSITILEVDKRELGRAVADALPGELRRLGVRVRAS